MTLSCRLPALTLYKTRLSKGKLGKNETAARATQDGAGNTISTTYASKADVSALLSTKLGVTATAYAATRDGAGNNIVDTYAKKTDISGMVKSVNGTAPDASGNVTVEEYTHPNSGVTAGTYRSVTVNAQGHVTDGSNPTLAIADGGTGATTAEQACANIGIGDYVIAQYCDSTYGDFYRVWKSGFVEQGGIVNSNTYWQVVTLYQEMADTNFNVIVSIKYNGDIDSKVYGIYAYPATAKTFNVYQDGWPSNDGTVYPIMWYAFGKGA